MLNKGNEISKSDLLFEEYYALHDEYTKKFGKNVAILMQVGKFYELYAPEDNSSSSNIFEITTLLNCKLTWKECHRMGGFPISSLDKNLKKLVENDYTVVVVDQVPSTFDGQRLSRRIVQVTSKGTNYESAGIRNNVMSIYVRKYGSDQFSFGVAVTDTIVSKTFIFHDIHTLNDDKGYALDTAIRFVSQYEPVECVVTTRFGESITTVIKHLGLKCPVYSRDVQNINEECLKDLDNYSESVKYAIGSLRTFLEDHAVESVHEQIDIIPYKSDKYLDLCSTAIKQLDLPLFLNRSYGINQTVTAMGQRLFTERLYSPIKDIIEVEKRYDSIENLKDDVARIKQLRNILKEVPDISRLHRSISKGRLDWVQFQILFQTYESVLPILCTDTRKNAEEIINNCKETIDFDSHQKTKTHKYSKDDDIIHGFRKLSLDNTILDDQSDDDIDKNVEAEDDDKKTTIKNIFVTGIHKDLDDIFVKVEESQTLINKIIDEAVSYLPKCNSLKLNKEKTGLITTHLRAEKLKHMMKDLKVIKMKSHSVIYTDQLKTALCYMNESQDEINKLTWKYFTTFQIRLYTRFHDYMEQIEKRVSELDVQQCSAMMAKKFRLHRPKVTAPGKNILTIKQLRHLLIEIINPESKYIPNDCILGEKVEKQGMLLYGVNSCGKTSYLKSVGLAVVMAQAGLFVPAESMEFSLQSRIMTRIAGTDNMERSQSSYIVELEELLSMLQRSDNETLILGDEMCRGTEVDSANAIVFTTLKTLVSRKSIFIAATHLHCIADKIRTELPSVKIYHMKVRFDENGNVQYDRNLLEGPGPVLYGLEIAKAMNFPKIFIENALKFRSNYTEKTNYLDKTTKRQDESKIVNVRKSRYNPRKILVKCECCSYQPLNNTSLPLDTHHIEFQCNADEDGYHGSQHKNALHNLVAVCKECHCKIHKNELKVTVSQGLRCTKYVFESIEEKNIEKTD